MGRFESSWIYEYFFHDHSGRKLASKINKNTPQKMVQLKETKANTLSAPAMLRTGKRTPSILQ